MQQFRYDRNQKHSKPKVFKTKRMPGKSCKEMEITMTESIGQKFNTKTLLKFAFPSIIMMIFMSLYTIVDGVFISRYLGSSALSAANIVYPAINLLYAVGIMLATGGSAIVAANLGKGKKKEGRDQFTFFVVVGLGISVLFLILENGFTTQISKLLGSNKELLADCNRYLRTLSWFAPASMLQMLFQMFFVTAGHPGLGLGVTVAGGVTNAVLDYVFLHIVGTNIVGAAVATGMGQLIPAVVGVCFFFGKKKDLHFSKFHMDLTAFLSACANGASEMVTNVSTAIVTYLFNIILMKMVGENGVAAITIILYAQFLFNSLFMGFSMGVAPVISYNYGGKREKELKKIVNISKNFMLTTSLVLALLSFFMADFVALIFVEKASGTFVLASQGLRIFALGFLFSGYNIFLSSYYTALGDGKTSAVISFSRTFVCILLSLIILPKIWGLAGVWLAIPVAELVSFVLCITLNRKVKVCYN